MFPFLFFVGCTPLHYAVRAGNPDITQVLTNYFTHYGLTVNTINKDGKSPLQEAYQFGHLVCAKILQDATSSKNITSETEDSTSAHDQRSHDHKSTTAEEIEVSDLEISDQPPLTSDEITPPAVTPRVEATTVNSINFLTTTPTGSASSSQPSSPKITEAARGTAMATVVSLSKSNSKNCLTAPLKTVTAPYSSKEGKPDIGRWATKCSLPASGSSSTSLSALPFETSSVPRPRQVTSCDEPETQLRSPSVEKKEALRKMLTRRSAYVLNQMSKPNEWNVTQLIVPSENDYRNDPAYMISVTHFAREMNGTEKKSPNCQKPASSVPSVSDKKAKTQERLRRSWRNDIKKLFDHYEYHCSFSYRRPARVPEDLNPADQSGEKDNETSHGGSGTGSSNVNASLDRVTRRQRRSSNFSRSSGLTDPPTQRKIRSRRSSILSQQSSGILAGVVRTGNAPKEYARTISTDSTRSSVSSQKPSHV